LSLAIGKKGQNVRLAAKLLGWRIDIKSEEEKRQEIESQMAAMALRGAPITNLVGLGEKTMQRLRDSGIETVEQLAQMTPDQLTEIQGIGEKTVERIRKVVTDYFEAGNQEEEAAAAPASAEAPAATEEQPAAQTEGEASASGESDERVSETEPASGEDESAQAAASVEHEVKSEAAGQPAKNEAGADEEAAPSEHKGGKE
jgi:N utilization substance protein A